MRVTHLRLRDFRSYTSAEVALGERLTIVSGPNGAGKTNLVEALYLGCVGRSCRTTSDRELVRFGAAGARVEVRVEAPDGQRELAAGIEPGAPRRLSVDGHVVDRLLDEPSRPLVGVFMPDRLELVKGPPAARRGHLDQVVAALWPARTEARRAYGRALAQRNALLGRIRAGAQPPDALAPWDAELATTGAAVMTARREATALLAPLFAERAGELGLGGDPALRYRPRSHATDAGALRAELEQRRRTDLERGFTGHGPHRDELSLARDGRELRTYGSQGQQRLAVLGLLLAERDAIADLRDATPLMLLDDVMSELDGERRARLVGLLAARGQSVITATEDSQVPAGDGAGTARIAVERGAVVTPGAATGDDRRATAPAARPGERPASSPRSDEVGALRVAAG